MVFSSTHCGAINHYVKHLKKTNMKKIFASQVVQVFSQTPVPGYNRMKKVRQRNFFELTM